MVLTFPSLGTFDSIWQRIDQEMSRHGLTIERARLAARMWRSGRRRRRREGGLNG